MSFLFFIFLFSIGYVSSDGYTCQNPIKLTPPDDLSKTVYWPINWNDSMPPIRFAANQECIWKVIVPEGLYATAVFYRNASYDISISVLFSNLNLDGINNNDHYPYMFTSPKFSIFLSKSQKQGLFSFKIVWSKYPNVTHDNVNLVNENAPTVMIPNGHLTTFTAETTVSFVAFNLRNLSHYPLLRQSAVFDGDSTNGTFLGNLDRIMIWGTERFSSGKTLTVYTWDLYKYFKYPLYMVQDHTNEPQIYEYKGWNCYTDTECSIQINAQYGTSVRVTSDSRPEFLKSFGTFSEDAILKIYEGPISNKTLVETLTKSNYQCRLPIELKNTIHQYSLESGIVDIELSYVADDANWNKVYDGRNGFIHSFYHGVNNFLQDTNETFFTKTTEKLYFNYIVRDADFTGNQTKLTVTVMMNGKQVSSSIYNSKNIPPTTTISIQGDTYNVKYETGEEETKGFRIDFSTTSIGYVTPESSISTLSSSADTTTTDKQAFSTAFSTRRATNPAVSSISSITTSTDYSTEITKHSTSKFPIIVTTTVKGPPTASSSSSQKITSASSSFPTSATRILTSKNSKTSQSSTTTSNFQSTGNGKIETTTGSTTSYRTSTSTHIFTSTMLETIDTTTTKSNPHLTTALIIETTTRSTSSCFSKFVFTCTFIHLLF